MPFKLNPLSGELDVVGAAVDTSAFVDQVDADTGSAIPSGGVLNITTSADGLSTSGSGSTISLAPADDLAGLEALTGNGVVTRTSADTYATNTIADRSIVAGDAGNTLQGIGPLSDGELVIGATGADPAAASLTAGAGISVTNGTNSITVAADIATQAEMEAATDNTVVATPGRTQYHPGVAKAWVYFNGSGTVAINASYNVDSITDNTTGDYSIVIGTDFSSTSYCAVGMCGRGSINGDALCAAYYSSPNAVGSFRVLTSIASVYSALDSPDIYVAMFGDQ